MGDSPDCDSVDSPDSERVGGPGSDREDVGVAAFPAARFRLPWPALAAVFVGGAAGTAARYIVESALPSAGTGLPIGTFAVNVVGAFVLGLLLESLSVSGVEGVVRQRVRLLLGTGFCGAFTTYSAFALDIVELGRDGRWPTALAYTGATVVLGLAAASAGVGLGAARRVR